MSEVASPSSIRDDREVKPLSCAKAGIPLYLLVDRFTQPMTVTLLSEPGADGYGKAESVPAGPGGGKLAVPEPFGITIDASTVPQISAREVNQWLGAGERPYGGGVLTAPEGLDIGALAAAVERGWGIRVAGIAYRPVGWGSHHWEVADGGGGRWFVTVDELAMKRLTDSDSLDDGFARLRASLRSAVDLRGAGREFVVAPVPAGGGEPVVRLGERFAVAVYPFVEGRSFAWDERDPAQRRGALGMVAAVHTAPADRFGHALADNFTIPFRDGLEAVCAGDVIDHGPYARRMAALLREHAAPIRRLLHRYDDLVRNATSRPGRVVLTHGEPHPGNTMLAPDGTWRLIDWDTVLIAPPERDLWDLDPGDGSILAAYTAATGVTPAPELLGLYRLRWDLADIAYDVCRFRRPHTGTEEDEKAWGGLCELVSRAAGATDRSG